MIDKNRLQAKCSTWNIPLTGAQLDLLDRYAELLVSYNEKVNLTAITSPEGIEDRHFADSLLFAAQPEVSGRLVDVGTGAGFPGIVAKIYKPDLELTLMEPTGKRVDFLRYACAELGLTGVEFAKERAEEAARKIWREQFDVASARAVAALPVLCEYCLPLVKVGGRFIAMKGPEADAEAKAAANALTAILSLHGPFGTTLAAARSQCQCEAQQDALLELQSLQNELGDAGRGMQLDLSLAGDMEYYNGLVFSGYVAGVPRAVLKGGRYDLLAQRFTPGACALGFALYLDELERLSAPLPPVQQQGTERQWLNIALPKDRLGDKAYGLLAAAGYEANENYNETRKLVVENPEAGVRYFLVKPSDVAIYVEHGAADIGIVGKDILTESGADVYELLDTGMGKCRMCVAGPRNFVDDESRALRVATKFVNIARAHYESIGRDIDIIKLNGSIELAPILGLSDVIVDIVETGTTLKENNLAVLEEFMPISARFIANKASYKFKYAQLTELLNKMKEALAK